MSVTGKSLRQSLAGVTSGSTSSVWTPLVPTMISMPSFGSIQAALRGIAEPIQADSRIAVSTVASPAAIDTSARRACFSGGAAKG